MPEDDDQARRAEVGVFGGSGFYEFLTDVVELAVDTPYGAPSEAVTIGSIRGRRVAFLPRHGHDHRFIPTTVPYRANVWAMKKLGVTSVVAPCSAGSLRPDLHPGDFVVIDQLIDRTWGRADTYHDGPPVHHQEFADPYDAGVRRELVEAGRAAGIPVHDGGTIVVIQGPRFSTRAESRWFREMGWHLVNMTSYPEAVLAREAGLRYAAVALVTDYDAGIDGQEPVTMETVFTRMAENVARVKNLIERAIPNLP